VRDQEEMKKGGDQTTKNLKQPQEGVEGKIQERTVRRKSIQFTGPDHVASCLKKKKKDKKRKGKLP